MKRWQRIALYAALVCVLALALLASCLGRIVDWAMTPRITFDAAAAPTPPDYTSDAHWSALPQREDAADAIPPGVSAIDQAHADVDAFYIHPTSYVGANWNAPVDHPRLNADTDRVATRLQASAFNGCCAVYAPRYRQANGTAFYRPSADGERAMDLAYQDVKRAFLEFQARRGPARPFVLAAHSQGSYLGARLLAELVHGTPLREQLVVAYLIGGVVTREGWAERAPDLPACASATDRHCVVAYQARGPAHVPTRFDLRSEDRRERLCVNPLSWTDESAGAEANLGAVFLESEDPAPRPAFADARCDHGILQISRLGRYERDLPSRVLDHVLGAENYHSIEYQLFFMNLRVNAQTRVAEARETP